MSDTPTILISVEDQRRKVRIRPVIESGQTSSYFDDTEQGVNTLKGIHRETDDVGDEVVPDYNYVTVVRGGGEKRSASE